MPSMLLLRILLLACAVSGSLVIACSDSAPSSGNTGDDDSDDDDSDDDNADDDDDSKPASKDAGKNDGGRRDGGRDGGGSSCTPGICTCDDGMMGVKTCMGADPDECTCAETTGEMGPPIETCPGDLTCGRIAGMGPYCLGPAMPPIPTAIPPSCPESKDCMELDLPGAQCITFGGAFSVCAQPCIMAGGTGGDAGSGGGQTSDAGAGSVDAGRDAASSSASDARVDSGRDR